MHDYLQLRFQEQIVTIFNRASYQASGGAPIHTGETGYCDAIVGLIGQSVVAMSVVDREPLVLRFQSGAQLCVPCAGEAVQGPEAWMIGTEDGPVSVQANV